MLDVPRMSLACRRVLTAALGALGTFMLLVAAPGQVVAQSQFAGVYTGTFFSLCDPDDGQFAALVETDGTALFLVYDRLDEEGGLTQGVNVNPDGSFTFTDIDGAFTTVVTGTFTTTGVSADYTVNGDGLKNCPGTLSGTKRPTTGFLAAAGGYYTGTLSGNVKLGTTNLGSTSGTLKIIAAADGQAFVIGFASGTIDGVPEETETGAKFTIASNGSISATLLDGTNITGSINIAGLSASGTFSAVVDEGAIHSGTWAVTRQLPLQAPPPPANKVPVAVLDTYEVRANNTLTVGSADGVLANDSDGDGDPLSAVLASTTANETLTLNSDGGFAYTPDSGFDGDDSFTYRASDGLATSNLATVTITVEPVKALPWLTLLLD